LNTGAGLSFPQKNDVELAGAPLCHWQPIRAGRSTHESGAGEGPEALRFPDARPHGNGDFFGEGCLTGQPLRLATVVAMTESVIMRLDKAAIIRVLRDEPKFSEMFMSYLLAEQVPQARFHRVQRRPGSPQLPAERGLARQSPNSEK
jgi:Cyclic nucleotide-binding domain